MNHYAGILSRVLTVEFYRVNAGFFLLVAGVCFGFLRAPEHLALAGFFVSTLPTLLIPLAVWIAYTLRVIGYNAAEIPESRNLFIYSTSLLPWPARWGALLTVAYGQLAPVSIYALFLCVVAVRNGQLLAIPPIVASIVLLHAVVSWLLDRALLHPDQEVRVSAAARWVDRSISKPMAWMLAGGILRTQPALIYGTKIVTCLVVYGTTQLYLYDDYDARLYWMTASVAFSANVQLVYYYHRYEFETLYLFRSLPISPTRRVLSLLAAMLVLCFPEVAMLGTNLPAQLSIADYAQALVFGATLLLFAYGALYVRDSTFDHFTRWIFFVGMGWTLAILFGLPVLAGAAAQGVAGVVMLRRYFYRFEPAT